MADQITRLRPSRYEQSLHHQRRHVATPGDILNLARENQRVHLDFSTTAGAKGRMEIELYQGTPAGDRFRQLCVGGHYRNSRLSRGSGGRWRGGDNVASGFVFFVHADERLQDETNMLFGKVVNNGLNVLTNATGAAPNSRVFITGCGEIA